MAPHPLWFPLPRKAEEGEGERVALGTHGLRRGLKYAARHGGLTYSAYL
jgi:hypothetical protein